MFIPLGYFENTDGEMVDQYRLIRLGRRYEELREVISELKAEGFMIRGFGDMSIGELAKITGLSPEEASLAKQREFDEPFIFSGTEEDVKELKKRIAEKGLAMTRGEFYHLLGGTDKGRAVMILTELYTGKYGNIQTVAIGDSLNDLPMFEVVDQAYLLQKLDGSYDKGVDKDHIQRVPAPGPEGWNKTVINIIKGYEEQ
ncbi:MAG: mannosyl-3-phosphoglycerate phosphatase [Nitrospirae bacterium]|nr:MAG: mannosyl-3-phosphoglycerate phosphatase [Nitrospirota bacterium]